MYYDVVASLYSPDGFLRLDAHLVAGGFETLAAADAWRNDHRAEIERLNDSEEGGGWSYIADVEVHDADGTLIMIA